MQRDLPVVLGRTQVSRWGELTSRRCELVSSSILNDSRRLIATSSPRLRESFIRIFYIISLILLGSSKIWLFGCTFDCMGALVCVCPCACLAKCLTCIKSCPHLRNSDDRLSSIFAWYFMLIFVCAHFQKCRRTSSISYCPPHRQPLLLRNSEPPAEDFSETSLPIFLGIGGDCVGSTDNFGGYRRRSPVSWA